jgi:hypothetical protein
MAEWIDAEDDQDAIRQAEVLNQGARKCEVWNDNRLVATIAGQIRQNLN